MSRRHATSRLYGPDPQRALRAASPGSARACRGIVSFRRLCQDARPAVRVGSRGIVLLVCVLPAVVAGGARAGTARSTAVRTADAAIRQLNAERAATGIPGRIVENRAWSERCLEHARWMQRNHLVQHDETPGTPMYTAAGAWAGVRSVLSGGYPWTTRRTPWDSAPMHLAQLLAPQLRRMGVGLFRGWACATTLPGYGRGRAHRNVVY